MYQNGIICGLVTGEGYVKKEEFEAPPPHATHPFERYVCAEDYEYFRIGVRTTEQYRDQGCPILAVRVTCDGVQADLFYPSFNDMTHVDSKRWTHMYIDRIMAEEHGEMVTRKLAFSMMDLGEYRQLF